MSKKPSHIPVFPDAYLRDNYRLTLEQHGLFLLLMMEAWNSENCTLADDEKTLAEIGGVTVAKFRKIAPQVLEKWTREGGRIYQKRLLKEWHYVREKSGKRKASAETRWEREKLSKCNANGMHLGGGEGGGASTKDRPLGGGARLEDDGPFRIVTGGRDD